MSTIKVDTIQKTTGVEVYTVNAWANVDQSGTQSIRGSGNVSSITDLGTGYTRVTFSSNAPAATYAVPSAAGDATAGNGRIALPSNGAQQTTSYISIQVDDTSSTASDAEYLHVSAIWG